MTAHNASFCFLHDSIEFALVILSTGQEGGSACAGYAKWDRRRGAGARRDESKVLMPFCFVFVFVAASLYALVGNLSFFKRGGSSVIPT